MKKFLALALISATPLICHAGKECCESEQKTEKKETKKESENDSCSDKEEC